LRVVFDTNIFVSAFVFPGGTADLAMLRMFSSQDQLCTSRILLLELSRVLAEKFKYNTEEISRVAMIVTERSELIQPQLKLAVLGDEPDNRVLECAVAAKADIIVTGDKAMLALKAYNGIRIITLKAYLAG
jgi:putative PIN family toxin of toxin-antitoxin system